MPASSLTRLKGLFEAAMQLSGPELEAFLTSTCGDDPATRGAVEALLAAHSKAGHFLDPLDGFSGAAVHDSLPPSGKPLMHLLGERRGTVIDRYQLLDLIGEGGFGTVLRAQQLHPVRREVALKIIKLGMDTAQVVARFEAERQALAMMDHPNIARVFDAGSTEHGRPYFVMELVSGPPITQYCDTARLGIRQRLELFIPVCQAVQHAHQKGIIHRDIKPGNVLVAANDGVALPKVIDFGVAKAIGGASNLHTLASENRLFIGTPQYMSPEQAGGSGSAVDTRGDIYSLGATLYELLSGVCPFDSRLLQSAGVDQVLRTIREVEPARPSARVAAMGEGLSVIARSRRTEPARLSRLLTGELDWIVTKSMEKEPARRYDSANDLAADLGRFLRGEPISAGPSSAGYRIRKMARQHRFGLIAIASIIVSLLVGFSIAAIEAVRAYRAERAQAALRADAVEKLWTSDLAAARAGRYSGRPGQRVEGLRILREAALIRSSRAVRNEAVGCMSLVDVEPARTWDYRRTDSRRTAFDRSFQHYAHVVGDGQISIRRSSDDRELVLLPSPGSIPDQKLDFSPDGRLLAAVHADPEVGLRIWNWAGRRIILNIPHAVARGIDFSPDNRFIAVAVEDGKVGVYDLTGGKKVKEFAFAHTVPRMRYAPDGKRIAAYVDGADLQIISVDDGKLLTTIQPPCGSIEEIAWHPQGKTLAICGKERSNRIFILDAATGKELAILQGHQSLVVALEFSRSGDLLASGAFDSTARLWEPLAGRQLLQMTGFNDLLQVSEDESLIAFGHNALIQTCRLIKSRECGFVGGYPQDQFYVSAQFSPDGNLVAAAGGTGVRFWDLSTGRCAGFLPLQSARSVVFTPDGKSVLVTLAEGTQRFAIPPPASADEPCPQVVGNSTTGALALCQDGKTIINSVVDGPIVATNLNDLTVGVKLGSHSATARFVAISPDGAWAASSTRHELSIKVWNLKSGTLAAELPASNTIREMGQVAFSPDAKSLVTSDMGAYSWWEVGTWKLLRRMGRDNPTVCGLVAFSPAGDLLALAGDGQKVLLLNARSGAELVSLDVPEPHLEWWLAFNQDGSRLVAAAQDPVLTVWNLSKIRTGLATMGLDWGSSK